MKTQAKGYLNKKLAPLSINMNSCHRLASSAMKAINVAHGDTCKPFQRFEFFKIVLQIRLCIFYQLYHSLTIFFSFMNMK